MNRSIAWLALCQGLFLTNNVVFIAINGLVGLHLAPAPWMATLPVMGYVVGGAAAVCWKTFLACCQKAWARIWSKVAGHRRNCLPGCRRPQVLTISK